ncbi:MAG: hypothetical protein V7K21_13430 [Nostoc sp.]|uniref:hypothetical protein n=1 Tax=Nostoc sp. TaxID=1180 RepID=UPI002FF6F81F
MITYSELSTSLPAGSLEFVGNSQVKLNFNQITGDNLTFNTSAIKGILKFLEALAEFTVAINTARAAASPPLAPIELCEKHLTGTIDAPTFQYVVVVGIDPESFINNVIDPTA